MIKLETSNGGQSAKHKGTWPTPPMFAMLCSCCCACRVAQRLQPTCIREHYIGCNRLQVPCICSHARAALLALSRRAAATKNAGSFPPDENLFQDIQRQDPPHCSPRTSHPIQQTLTNLHTD